MTFSDLNFTPAALKCLAVVVLLAGVAVGLGALGAWWMGRWNRRRDRQQEEQPKP